MTTPERPDGALAGQVLGGRYDLLELLGLGGMGAVYRARDRELDELVALKVIRAELAREPAMVERFRHEVRLARRVTHVNVARTFELGRAGDVVFCTMELVTGESLTERLRRDGRLEVGEAAAIACALCDGLAVAHAAGVIHRDIKPDNVLIAGNGRVVLADFGVAALAAARGELSGTPTYMAPEQARGEAPTPATDVYSVGIVLHEALTGRRPFEGTVTEILAAKQELARVEPLADGLPPELAHVVGRATARDPGARIATASELRRELAPWAGAHRLATETVTVEEPAAQATVLVVAPAASADTEARLYLADAICTSLLVQLSRAKGLRVLARADDSEPATVVATFELGTDLAVRLQRDDRTLVLHVPLATDQIAASAHAIATAIAGAVTLPAPSPRGVALEARDLALRARHGVGRGIGHGLLPLEQVERARQLAPDDPYVAAALAIVYTRHAFFLGDAPPDTLVQAAAAARAAVASAPDLADAHVALGHVQLHTGHATEAARCYRRAIACAPLEAEAHDYLGRMLLEAGYVEDAVARLEAAIAVNPARVAGRWEIARAYALEGRWQDFEHECAALVALRLDRAFLRARFAAWRHDLPQLRALRAGLGAFGPAFVTGFSDHMWDVFIDGRWHEHKQALMQVVASRSVNARRTAFLAQLVAELAGYAGDAEAAGDAIEHGIAVGLFDLHWLDRCPLLEGLRALPRCAALRAPIKQRAEAILDALYGEQNLATVDTAIAPSALLSRR